MRHRWRTLVRPDAIEHHASPDAGEAFGVWMLGVLWALACLWLGYLGSPWVLPGALLAGLLALWGWRHFEWLWWFPAVLVVATMLEPLSPLPMRSRFGPLVYIDLLTIGVVLVSVVRAVGLGRPLLPRTPVDGLVIATLAGFTVSMFLPGARERTLMDLKQFLVLVVVFYATTTVASRPRGSRWVWIAFPLASLLIGLHAILELGRGGNGFGAAVRVADLVWGSRHGVFNALLVALPVTAGLALSAGQSRARVVWMLAAVAGAAGLGIHLARGGVFADLRLSGRAWTPHDLCRTGLAWITLSIVGWLALRVRAGRLHEGPRWLAVTLTLGLFGALELAGSLLSGPALALLAVASGLVVGTLRADRRAMRSGRRIEPLEKAA